MSSVKTLGVVGAGQMGAGIAQVAAQSGLHVLLADISDEAAEAGKAKITKFLTRAVAKGRATQEDADAALGRISTAGSMNALAEADFVVEAATENVALKLRIFEQLDSIVPAGVILATNTSSISITKIAAATARPELVIGMHFMNPVPIMKLVEVISGLRTSEETLATTLALAEGMGKTCVAAKDFPGFAVNRILMPMINEAFYTLYEGIATAEGIDAAGQPADPDLAAQQEQAYANARSNYQTYNAASIAMFSLAGAAAVGGVVWLLLDSGDDETSAAFGVLPTAQGVHGFATWRF